VSALKVVHLSVVHRPDDARIYERECRTLAAAGYDVTYLVPGATPGRDRHGVRFAALPARPRARRWMSTPDIVAALRTLRPFVVHTHDPELLPLYPFLRPFVPRLVHDAHEFLREQVMAKEYVPARVRPLVATASSLGQRGLTHWADGIVTVTDDVLNDFGPHPRQSLIAPNYPRLSHFAGAAPFATLSADPRLRLVYIGALSRSRGIALMLDVMERLAPGDALLLLGGTFSSAEFEAEIGARLRGGLNDRVHFLGRVARDQVPRYLASAEVVWTPSSRSPQFSRPTVATKIYEGAAVGLAALATDLPGREVIVDEGFGITVPAGVEGHLAGVRRLIAERGALPTMGARGRAAVLERFSWEQVEPRFLSFYAELCAAQGARGHGRNVRADAAAAADTATGADAGAP
jgi:glycosyltransferase involved in cell wall biosynthesis